MLEINQLTINYGSKEVLKKLSLSVDTASIHGVMGYNGAGKTTLFRTLYAWLNPLSGTINWKKSPIKRQDISFMETHNYFYPYMLGKEYLELIKADQDAITRWARVFDLPLDQRVDQYSTGMKKKIALAGIMLLDRPLMLLDEPFSGVDIENNEKINLILHKLKEQGKTILISSHSIHHLMQLCDKISVLEEGVFVNTYDKKDFPQLQEHFQERIEKSLDDF